MENKLIELTTINSDIELSLMDQSIAIMHKLVSKYNDEAELNRMSIDKTDSVLRIVDTATKISNQQANNRLRLLSMKSESEDRSRLLNILQNTSLRNAIKEENDRIIDLDSTILDVDLVDGEMTFGIEQLTLDGLSKLVGDVND